MDDPNDWSPLRRRVEGLRLLQDLKENGPRLCIPQDLLRHTLAGQYGCSPEEVTQEQIMTELRILSAVYPTIHVTPYLDRLTSSQKPPSPQDGPSAQPSASGEVERRSRLLAEYKAATKVDSNRKIYSARNSGVHKPEFYKWLKGKLPADSSTSRNLERFLTDKKPPISREK